jgi:hypothetical protein
LNLTGAGLGVDLFIPTVPFGINFGHINIWNGSVILGGRYDANRINSTSWALLPESANGNSTFLKDGTQKVNVTLTFRGRSESFPATLDINHDAIVLPSSFNCSNAVVESLAVGVNSPNSSDPILNVVIPSNLTSSTDRCIQLAENDPNNNIVLLGRPFFQATYAYVDKEGQLYLAAAHRYDLGIDAQPFNPTATMTPAASPPPRPSPTPTKNAADSLRTTNTFSSTRLYLAVLILVVSMTAILV